MFKFMRKYMKWILAVGGALLMIVFLIPQAITSLSQRAAVGSAVWATVGPDNEDVPAEALRQARRELEVLERLQRAGVGLGQTDLPEHWYLLTREAELTGVLGGSAIDQLPPEQIQTLRAVAGSGRDLDAALTKTFAIARMKEMYIHAARLSDHRLRAEAERLFHAVDGRAVIIEADPDAAMSDPTEDEIVAQWEAYKDVAPTLDAPTGDEPGYGYRLPDRFKIEWLRVNTDDIRTMVIESGAVDQIALFKHWKRHATDPARGLPDYESGVAIPDIVREDLIGDLVAEKREAIRRAIKDQFVSSQRRLRRTDEGYYDLPDDWADQRVSLEALATDLQTTDEFAGLPLPTYRAIGDRWLTVDDLAEIDDLSNAGTTAFGSTRATTTRLVAAAREFGADASLLIQEGVASPALTDASDDSLVFFRLTATDPSRAAHNVDEVRDAVVTDLRRKAHYEQLRWTIPTLEATARDKGLLALAMDHGTEVRRLSRVTLYNMSILDFQLQSGRLAPFPSSLPVLGSDLDVIGELVDRAIALGTDPPLAERPIEERSFVLPVNNRTTLLVVELTNQYPLDAARFAQLAGSGALENLLLNEELLDLTETPDDAFSYETMRVRHNFNIKQRQTDDEEEDAETTAPDAATADAR